MTTHVGNISGVRGGGVPTRPDQGRETKTRVGANGWGRDSDRCPCRLCSRETMSE